VRLSIVALALSCVAFAAPPKKKKVAAPKATAATIATEVAIKKTLDGVEGKVGGCVLDNAGPAAFTLEVKAKITLNSAGQLMGTTITMAPDGGVGGDKTRACIDGVLKELVWPKSNAPLINAERQWTFSTESK
jgi:hypothetical protein